MAGDIQKLVRDLIPDKMEPNDRQQRASSASPEMRSRLLALKWAEESAELQKELHSADKSKIIDEMADVQEVLEALRVHFNISQKEVSERQQDKFEQRGGFNELAVLRVPLPTDTNRWHLSHIGPIVPFINQHIVQSVHIRIAVSFILDSGLRLLIDAIKQALANGCRVDLLTSRYLDVTEPQALRRLLGLNSPLLNVRLYDREGKSFHAKAWIFTHADKHSYALVGSSNISFTALKNGVEWNYHVHETDSGWPVDEAKHHFDDLFRHPATQGLTTELVDEYEKNRTPSYEVDTIADPNTVTPNPAQREALLRLNRLRADGHARAMVIAATGIGKTWLAAFDSESFERVLFIAHRKELLEQAEKTFRRLRPFDTVGRLYDGESGDSADLVFASMQTLGRENWLDKLSPSQFDYIVVDEFHHAGSRSYLNILKRFKPRFLLGLTATPYRSDNCDLLELCDGNVAYRITLHEAIGLGWLAPFRYFGLNDDTDYSGLRLQNGEYRIDELERLIINQKRNTDILSSFRQYAGRCAVGFCASIRHADDMAVFFNANGIRSAALHSAIKASDDNGLSALREGRIEVLFAVDMLNEGVDVPEIDLVMFLRPTQSVTVFLQQLGRGLRLHDRKSHLTALDFIGNYRNAEFKLPTLMGEDTDDVVTRSKQLVKHLADNDGVLEAGPHIRIQLDEFSIAKLKALARDPINDRLIEAFKDVERELRRHPSILDIHQYGRYKPRTYLQTFKSRNDGGESGNSTDHWIAAIEKAGLSTEVERNLGRLYGSLLATVERTAMTRCYKMVILLSLLGRKALHRGLTIGVLAEDFRRFYREHPVARMEMSEQDLAKLEDLDDKKLRKLILDMPVHHWEQKHFALDDTKNIWRCVSLTEEPSDELYTAIKERVSYRIAMQLERFDTALSKFKIVCGQQQNDRPHINIQNLRLNGVKPEGWHKIEVDSKTLYMKIAKIAVNIVKTEPDDNQSIPNLLGQTLLTLFGVQSYSDLQGRHASIEPNHTGDGFVMTRFRARQGEPG